MSLEEPWHQCHICGETFHELNGHVARGDSVCEYCVKEVTTEAKKGFPDFPKEAGYNTQYYERWHEIARARASDA
jgi:hypothetical protein